jgi:hypothetical protein
MAAMEIMEALWVDIRIKGVAVVGVQVVPVVMAGVAATVGQVPLPL